MALAQKAVNQAQQAQEMQVSNDEGSNMEQHRDEADIEEQEAKDWHAQMLEQEKNALWRAKCLNREMTIAEAKQYPDLDVNDPKQFLAKTAPYLITQHEFEIVDKDIYGPDPKDFTKQKLLVKAHIYGRCIHCGKTFDQCMKEGQESLFACSGYANRKAKYQATAPFRAQRR